MLSFAQLLLTFAIPLLGGFNMADAAAGDYFTGWAWSSNSGYVAMNCNSAGLSGSTCSTSNWGVSLVTPGNIILKGYAWSSNLGWITFTKANLQSGIEGCPDDPTAGAGNSCYAKYDPVTGKASGWARACSVVTAGTYGCIFSEGNLKTNMGAWDGWIHLSGTAVDGTKYGVMSNGTSPSCGWTGYAWGSDAIGWINFSGTALDGSQYGVTGTNAAVCTGRKISCGVNVNTAPLGGIVQWQVLTSGLGTPTYLWGGTDISGSNTSATFNTSYASVGVKTAYVDVTVPSGTYQGTYRVACDASAITGSPSPWYASVTTGGNNDLQIPGAVSITGSLTVNQPITFTANVTNAGTADVVAAFQNQFQIDLAPNTNPNGDWQLAGTVINSVTAGGNQNTSLANWTPTSSGTYRVRVLTDSTGVITETNGGGTGETNNYSNAGAGSGWQTFTVAGLPPLVGTSATCKASPGLTQIGKPVIWSVTGVTGGTGSLTYDWTFGQDAVPTTSTGATASPVTYATIGSKTASVTVHSPGVSDLVVSCTGITARIQRLEEI